MASQLNDLLVASGIAQLSNYGFSALQTDVKKAVSEMILDHLPQKVVLELASSICDSLARGKHPHFEYNIDDSTITLTKSEVSPSSGTGSTQEEKDALLIGKQENNFRDMLASVTKTKSIDTSNNQPGTSSPKTEIQSSPKSEVDLLSQLTQKKPMSENENLNLDAMMNDKKSKKVEEKIDQTSLDQIKKIFETGSSKPQNNSSSTDPFGNLYSLLQNKIESQKQQSPQNVSSPAVNNVNNFLAQMQAAQNKKNSQRNKFNSSSPIIGSPSGIDSPSSNLQQLLNNLNNNKPSISNQSTGNPILDLLKANKDQGQNKSSNGNIDTESLVHLGKSLMERMHKKEDITDSISHQLSAMTKSSNNIFNSLTNSNNNQSSTDLLNTLMAQSNSQNTPNNILANFPNLNGSAHLNLQNQFNNPPISTNHMVGRPTAHRNSNSNNAQNGNTRMTPQITEVNMEQWAHTRLQAFKTFIHKFGKEDSARLIEECRNTLNETLGCDISEHDLVPINYNFEKGRESHALRLAQEAQLNKENNGSSGLLNTDKRVLPLNVTKYPSQARYRWRQSRVKNFKSYAQRFGRDHAVDLLNDYIVQLNSVNYSKGSVANSQNGNNQMHLGLSPSLSPNQNGLKLDCLGDNSDLAQQLQLLNSQGGISNQLLNSLAQASLPKIEVPDLTTASIKSNLSKINTPETNSLPNLQLSPIRIKKD